MAGRKLGLKFSSNGGCKWEAGAVDVILVPSLVLRDFGLNLSLDLVLLLGDEIGQLHQIGL
jgi:hypothetical protein